MAARKPRILFACVGNSARSQMAEAFCRAMGGDRVECASGGSRPLGSVLPEAVEAMAERGIDISRAESRGFDEAWVAGCDLVVTMGCGDDACPAFVGKRIVGWDLPDPKGKPMQEFRRVRDLIEGHVEILLGQWLPGGAAGTEAQGRAGGRRGGRFAYP